MLRFISTSAFLFIIFTLFSDFHTANAAFPTVEEQDQIGKACFLKQKQSDVCEFKELKELAQRVYPKARSIALERNPDYEAHLDKINPENEKVKGWGFSRYIFFSWQLAELLTDSNSFYPAYAVEWDNFFDFDKCTEIARENYHRGEIGRIDLRHLLGGKEMAFFPIFCKAGHLGFDRLNRAFSMGLAFTGVPLGVKSPISHGSNSTPASFFSHDVQHGTALIPAYKGRSFSLSKFSSDTIQSVQTLMRALYPAIAKIDKASERFILEIAFFVMFHEEYAFSNLSKEDSTASNFQKLKIATLNSLKSTYAPDFNSPQNYVISILTKDYGVESHDLKFFENFYDKTPLDFETFKGGPFDYTVRNVKGVHSFSLTNFELDKYDLLTYCKLLNKKGNAQIPLNSGNVNTIANDFISLLEKCYTKMESFLVA